MGGWVGRPGQSTPKKRSLSRCVQCALIACCPPLQSSSCAPVAGTSTPPVAATVQDWASHRTTWSSTRVGWWCRGNRSVSFSFLTRTSMSPAWVTLHVGERTKATDLSATWRKGSSVCSFRSFVPLGIQIRSNYRVSKQQLKRWKLHINRLKSIYSAGFMQTIQQLTFKATCLNQWLYPLYMQTLHTFCFPNCEEKVSACGRNWQSCQTTRRRDTIFNPELYLTPQFLWPWLL